MVWCLEEFHDAVVKLSLLGIRKLIARVSLLEGRFTADSHHVRDHVGVAFHLNSLELWAVVHFLCDCVEII